MIRARRLDDGSFVQVLPDGSTRALESRTDWEYLRSMTEEEIEANAASDPDNPPLTAAELARMMPVPNAREIRKRLHPSQEQFANSFHLPLGTVRDWELGRREPDSAAKNFLRVIGCNPEAVKQELNR